MRYVVSVSYVADEGSYADEPHTATYEVEAAHENEALLIAAQMCASTNGAPVATEVLQCPLCGLSIDGDYRCTFCNHTWRAWP